VIQPVFPSADGVVRSVELRTPTGTLRRPVQRLHAFELNENHPLSEVEHDSDEGTDSSDHASDVPSTECPSQPAETPGSGGSMTEQPDSEDLDQTTTVNDEPPPTPYGQQPQNPAEGDHDQPAASSSGRSVCNQAPIPPEESCDVEDKLPVRAEQQQSPTGRQQMDATSHAANPVPRVEIINSRQGSVDSRVPARRSERQGKRKEVQR
jgi:hypothetical protein